MGKEKYKETGQPIIKSVIRPFRKSGIFKIGWHSAEPPHTLLLDYLGTFSYINA
jgi:hypothetical protein